MPTLARPEVDVLEGLTTAIIVDQERMGADPRSTVGTATDANAMLRILFSHIGKPHIAPARPWFAPQAGLMGDPASSRRAEEVLDLLVWLRRDRECDDDARATSRRAVDLDRAAERLDSVLQTDEA